METSYLTILGCGILSMIIGGLWYGPLFGKLWMEILGATEMDIEKRKEMQKEAGKLYLIQFLLTLMQLYFLDSYIQAGETTGLINALIIWLAFVMPTIAGSSMWTNDSTKVRWTKFFIQSGYQLVMLAIYGVILGLWG